MKKELEHQLYNQQEDFQKKLEDQQNNLDNLNKMYNIAKTQLENQHQKI